MAKIDLTAVLAEINKIRASVGLKPLKRIQKGIRSRALCCPLAKSIGAWVQRDDIFLPSVTEVLRIPMPPILGEFIAAFDRGDLPQFDRKGGK